MLIRIRTVPYQRQRDACTSIDVNEKGIGSLIGIEYFTALTELDCATNSLESLDVSACKKLTILLCNENNLTALDVSKNTELEVLRCDWNYYMTALDVSKNTKLTALNCSYCKLTSLDVSKNTALQYLYFRLANLTSLDVSKNVSLLLLDCSANALTNLDVSKNVSLLALDCGENALTSLDVSKCTKLKYLGCEENQLTSLNINKNTSLQELECGDNYLASLNVSKNTKLEKLECGNNYLTNLNVSKNTELTELICNGNALTSLNLDTNTKLTKLNCEANNLPYLNNVPESVITLYASNNVYYVELTAERTFDLSRISDFDISKMSNISGGTLSGKTLTFNEGSETVTYNYACNAKQKFSGTIKVKKTVSTITLNKTSATIVKGKTLQLTATVAPETASNKAVTWTTSDATVATVGGNGVITAVGNGTATISCTARDGSGVKATCKVKVKTLVTKVALSKTSANVLKGKTLQLTATITPSTASNKTVTWSTSNSDIATVSTDGLVTAKALGTATITCTAKDGSGKKATCKITVTNPVTKVKLNQTQATLSLKETLQLKATVTPSTAANKAVTWKSSNTTVATVSSSGKVTAKSGGTVTITCTAKDGSGKKATCKITVYTNTEAFVARIYTKALSRTAEEAGLKYWTEEINSGRRTPVEVAECFFFAPEFTNKNLSNAEYVKVLYRTFMGREYDEAGLNYWVGRLNKGESRKSVLESFAGCQEFKDIVKSFGL